jgi:hypothetical protein
MPGRWQSYDIIFHAARFDGNSPVRDALRRKIKNAQITIWHNGVLIHNDVEMANKTGAGRPEGPDPGPILLQEHGNEILFRNILDSPPVGRKVTPNHRGGFESGIVKEVGV